METSSITSQRGFTLTGHCESSPTQHGAFVVWAQTTEDERGERHYYYQQNGELVGETRQTAPRTVADTHTVIDYALAKMRELLVAGASDQDLHNDSEYEREAKGRAS